MPGIDGGAELGSGGGADPGMGGGGGDDPGRGGGPRRGGGGGGGGMVLPLENAALLSLGSFGCCNAAKDISIRANGRAAKELRGLDSSSVRYDVHGGSLDFVGCCLLLTV